MMENKANTANENMSLPQPQRHDGNDVVNELDKAYSQVRLTREVFSAAKENLQTIEDKHTLGNVRALLDVFEAQDVLQQARDRYDEAVTNYFVILDESQADKDETKKIKSFRQ